MSVGVTSSSRHSCYLCPVPSDLDSEAIGLRHGESMTASAIFKIGRCRPDFMPIDV